MAFIVSLLEEIRKVQDARVDAEKNPSLFERYLSSFSYEYRGL